MNTPDGSTDEVKRQSETFTELADEDLLQQTKAWVQQEKKATLKILNLLKEIERRRLYLAQGFNSLYSYATQELGYSESQAHRRIASMRLMIEVPEIEAKIAEGKLTLATAAQAQVFFRRESKATGTTRSVEAKRQVLVSLEGQSKRTVEKSLLELCPATAQYEEREKEVSADLTEIVLRLTSEQLQLLHRLKDLKPAMATTAELLEWVLQRTLKQIDPLKQDKSSLKKESPFCGGIASQGSSESQRKLKVPSRGGGRYIPSSYRKELWSRSRGQCEFTDSLTSQRCQCRRGLEVDHIQPLALGGKTELENLRMLCRQHNQWAAQRVLGESKMQGFLKKENLSESLSELT